MKWTKTTFGMALEHDVPEGCDVVVLCADTAFGLKPQGAPS